MIKTIEKYGAEWCGPCRVLDKILDQLTDVKVVKFDADENEEEFEQNEVLTLPFMIFKDENDKAVVRVAGLLSLEHIHEIIQEHS